MRVSSEVLEYVFGASERGLGVGRPVFVPLNPNHHPLAVDVLRLQVQRFHGPKTRSIYRFENRTLFQRSNLRK
jgi:hypothetical protein